MKMENNKTDLRIFETINCEKKKEILKVLCELVRKNKKESQVVLSALLSHYTNLFIADNNKIWTFFPSVLIFVGYYFSIKDPSVFFTLILCASSIAITLFWLVNAENHRAFQNKSMLWISAILEVNQLKLSDEFIKLPDDSFNKVFSHKSINKNSIRGFAVFNILIWLVILFFRIYDTYPFMINLLRAYIKLFASCP